MIIQEFIEYLKDDDALTVFAALAAITQTPFGDVRIIQYLESLLEDKRLSRVAVPFYGSLRMEAAYALAAERAKLGNMQLVTVKSVFNPVKRQDIAKLSLEAGIEIGTGDKAWLHSLQLLLDKGYIKLFDLNITPAEYKSER